MARTTAASAAETSRGRTTAAGAPLVLALVFFASGAGALVIETTWMRWLRLLFGATAPAAAATLVAFLAGHALGAAAAARLAPRWRRPLRAYAAIELVAAAGALATPLVLALGDRALGALYDGLRDDALALGALRFAIALAATLPAACAFGAGFPAIGAAAIASTRRLGARGSALYGANALGGALGAGLAAFWLPDAFGVPGGYGVGVALSLTAALVALALARGAPEEPSERLAGVPAAPRAKARAVRGTDVHASAALPIALAALSGFGALATQVLLVQAFGQVTNQSAVAFGVVLVAVLATLALGAGLVAAIEGRLGIDPRTILGLALAGAGLGLVAFPSLLYAATGGFAYLGGGASWTAAAFATLASVAVTAGPALLAASTVFPLCMTLEARRAREGAEATHGGVGAILGRLVAANALGSVAGALAAPFVLLPWLGLWPSFAALSLLYAVPALLLPDAGGARRLLRDAVLALGWIGVLWDANPLAVPPVRLEPGEHLIAASTSASGVVAVIERDGERVLRTDNYAVLGGTADRVHQERQGHLAALLAPGARSVAYVGSATGISAGALLAHPIRRLQLVEIVPGVAEAAGDRFADANRGVMRDPRVETVIADARSHLAATRERFDLVVADLFVPWRTGAGSLYAREHFETVRARLSDDGVFVQWLPLYQLSEPELRCVMATFGDVFPRSAIFRGDFYGGFPIVALAGFRGRVPAEAEISAAALRLAEAGEKDRWVTDPLGPFALYVGPLAPFAASLADVPRNSDAWPRIEFMAAKSNAGGKRGKLDPVVPERWPALDAAIRAAAFRDGDDVFPALSPEARRTAEGGAALQDADALFVMGRFDESARAFAAAQERMPRRLLRDAPDDPTAAEVGRTLP